MQTEEVSADKDQQPPLKQPFKRIGIFTSGGDAPGMNAAIRAVVRAALYYHIEVAGIHRGYAGMISGDIVSMNSKSVANIIQKGGTILKSARCDEFRMRQGRQKAIKQLKAAGIDALVGIGGDGTLTGASYLHQEFDIPVVCIPATIDNDISGTDFAIGYDTAINTAVSAIDKIRETADSHNRLFLVEVMGRASGLIALSTGIATGAEAIVIPERSSEIDVIFDRFEESSYDQTSQIIIVAEGHRFGSIFQMADYVKQRFPEADTRVSILGHIQRGGKPSCADRVLASRVGVAAIEGLLNGEHGKLVGIINNEVAFTPFENVLQSTSSSNDALLSLSQLLSL